jgi:Carboxypeptidase regulatory-like domain
MSESPAASFIRTLGLPAIWIALFSLLVSLAFGQTERTSITGSVTDRSKASLENANVTIRNVATKVTNKTTTNSAGLYFITSLPPGTYELAVENNGFRQAVVRDIPLTTGLAATQDVVLEVGTLFANG